MRLSRSVRWSVIAVAALLLSSSVHAQGAFSLTFPANGATGILPTATLKWQPSSDAASYIVRIGTTNPPGYDNAQTVKGNLLHAGPERARSAAPKD